MKLRLPRWAHRLYARRCGYFWIPCPSCGQPFGGHEWSDIDGKVSHIPDPGGAPHILAAICPTCTRAGMGYYHVTEPPPTSGIAALRYAVAVSGGWEWCAQHQRPRWQGAAPCAPLHRRHVDPDDPVWCTTCERAHGPMDWHEGCEPVLTT